jgi:hypothetical protein
MQETVRQLTNYGGFIRNKNALTLTSADKETIDLMFEISKNEGERHGKMPTFGRTTSAAQESQEKLSDADEEDIPEVIEPPAKQPAKPAAQKPQPPKKANIEDELITIVDSLKKDTA